jgi:hypothetical protein
MSIKLCQYCSGQILKKRATKFCSKNCATKFYQRQHKEKTKAIVKKWITNNYIDYIKRRNKNSKKNRDKLSIGYIKQQLRKAGFKVKDITNELIEERRMSIKLKRKINERRKEINPQRNN